MPGTWNDLVGYVRRLAQSVRHDALPQRPAGGARGTGRAQRRGSTASIETDEQHRARPVIRRRRDLRFSSLPSRGQRGRSAPAQRLAGDLRGARLSHRAAHPDGARGACSTGSCLRAYEPYRKLAAEQHRLNLDLRDIAGRGSATLVMEERTDQKPFAYTLYRGAYDQKRDRVEAASAQRSAAHGRLAAAQSPGLRAAGSSPKTSRSPRAWPSIACGRRFSAWAW